MRFDRLVLVTAALVLTALACSCDMKQPITAPIVSGGSVVVNEFLASNNSFGVDENGENDDWIELYNSSDDPIDLAGYRITDNLGDPQKYVIPSGSPATTTIPAHGYLLIWCDSQADQGPLHTGFNLSAGGEDIGVYDPSGSALTELTYTTQTTDVSYGRTTDGGSTWGFLTTPTPGASNSGGAVTNPKPVISAVALDPAVPQANAAVTVSATITDDGSVASATLYYNVGGGSFSSVTMTHAGSTYSGTIPGQAASAVVTYYLSATDDEAAVALLPSSAPAATFNYTVSSGSVPVLFVNEFLASNVAGLTDEMGDHEDWIEIYNPGSTPIDLGGMYITDDLAAPTKYQIPTTSPSETTVPAGGFLLLWADSEMGEGIRHVNIKLSASGEAIGLFTSAGESIDSTTFGAQAADVSMARVPDGSANWVTDTTPTPAASNGSVPRP